MREKYLRLTAWGLGLTPLLFYRSLEDAYLLPQRLGFLFSILVALFCLPDLTFRRGALHLTAGSFFAWRLVCLLAAGIDTQTTPALANLGLEFSLFLVAVAWPSQAKPGLGMAVLLGAALVSLLAVAQVFGLDPWAQGAVELGFSQRAHGSLGNPDFLGGYLALLAPLALLAAVRNGATWKAGVVAGTLGLALVLSQTRTAWAATVLGSLAALAMYGKAISKRRLMGAGLAAMLALGLTSVPGPHNPGNVNSVARLSVSDGGLHGRLVMSQLAWQVAKEHPLLGVGPGRFQSAYLKAQGKFLNSPEGRQEPYRFTPDAHNDWLQCAAENGLPGLALFIVLVALAMRACWRQKSFEGAALLGLFVAFSVEAGFHFPLAIAPSQALFWLGVGWAAGWEEVPTGTGKGLRWALLLVMMTAIFLTLNQAISSYWLNQGNSLILAGRDSQAIPALREATVLNPADARAWNALGAALDRASDFPGAIKAYTRALDAIPGHAEAHSNLGLARAKQGDLEAGMASTQAALALNPMSKEAWGNLGKILYLQGREAESIQAYEQGLARQPWAQGWFNLGAIHFNAGRRAEARRCFEESLKLDKTHIEARRLLAESSRAR